MSWESLGRGRLVSRRNVVVVRGGTNLTIALGCDLVPAFGDSRVLLMIGAGEHAGRLRIVKATRGGYAMRRNGKGAVGALIVRRMPAGWSQDKQQPTLVKHEIVDDGIEIDLPEWAGPTQPSTSSAPPPPAPVMRAPADPPARPPIAAGAARPMPPTAPAAPRPGTPPLPADETARRENAVVGAISECYAAGIRPSFADLARGAHIPQGSLLELLTRLVEAGRVTRDEHGLRPRGKPPLAEGKRTLLPSAITPATGKMTARR